MTSRGAPTAPKGLGPSGRRLWRSVQERFELDVHDELTLIEACRTADRCDQLAAEAARSGLTSTNKRGDLIATSVWSVAVD